MIYEALMLWYLQFMNKVLVDFCIQSNKMTSIINCTQRTDLEVIARDYMTVNILLWSHWTVSKPKHLSCYEEENTSSRWVYVSFDKQLSFLSDAYITYRLVVFLSSLRNDNENTHMGFDLTVACPFSTNLTSFLHQ